MRFLTSFRNDKKISAIRWSFRDIFVSLSYIEGCFRATVGYYPAAGYRSAMHAGMLDTRSWYIGWSSSRGEIARNAGYLNFSGSIVREVLSQVRAYGFCVRCVQEFANEAGAEAELAWTMPCEEQMADVNRPIYARFAG